MTDRVDLHEPYVDPTQQHEADMLGIYIFIATEAMLFSGLIAAIFTTRFLHTDEAVEASKHLHIWIGCINTVVLLTSSLFVAVAVHVARDGRRAAAALCLGLGALLGVGFLGIKGFEYYTEYTEGLLPIFSDPTVFRGPVEHQYMNIYLIATGLHALHLTVGICVLSTLVVRVLRRSLELPHKVVTIEAAGVYWHFVDVVWVFLYPILYLAR